MHRANAGVLALLAALCIPILVLGLDRYGVVNSDEAIYHGIAERMVASGDWLRLDFRGEPRFYDSFLNAPLHYWMRAALIDAFGSNAWTLRILSALCGVATVLATAGLAARLAGPRAALIAGIVQLTTFQFVYLHGARTGELDAIVSLLFVTIAWRFVRGIEDGRSFVPHHLLLCALVWTKAPLVLVPLAVELGHFALRPAARPRLRAWLVCGLALAPLALAWHALQLALWWERVPAVAATFWDQARGARTDGETLGTLGNLLFYARTLAFGAFPWSLVLPFALVAAWRDPARRWLLAWPAALLVFFTLVAKHYPWYAMPAYPFFSIALGLWLAQLGARTSAYALALAAATAALGLLAFDASMPEPLREVALTIPMEIRARGISAGVAGLAAGACGALVFLSARRGGRPREIAISALLVALGAAAALRIAQPLRSLDYLGPMDRLKLELARARAEGRPQAFPIRVPPGSPQIARFHFGEDFEIEARPTGGDTELWLHPADDLTVIERSIGRQGLERRLARAAQAQARDRAAQAQDRPSQAAEAR
jgi:4-amino-4-deoxy-L-arabinose transferase-like glycosyltransferase